MRKLLAATLYKLFPFDLKGDCTVPPAEHPVRVSCIINFYGRLDLLQAILFSLAEQNFPAEKFEILLVEDNGGTLEGRGIADEFSSLLPVRYFPLDANFGQMGYARNFAIARSKGEYILFLDDDTVLLQNYFLTRLVETADRFPDIGAFVPRGRASFAVINGRYDYHEPFFMTNRCMAYRRNLLKELGGFVSGVIGQEDVEFVARFHIVGGSVMNLSNIEYFHPPLQVSSYRKSSAVGASFYRLRSRYSKVLWLLLMLNCVRQAPLLLLPERRFWEKGRFAVGFIIGAFNAMCNNRDHKYVE